MVMEEVGESRKNLRNPRRKPETWDLGSSLTWAVLFHVGLLYLRHEASGIESTLNQTLSPESGIPST